MARWSRVVLVGFSGTGKTTVSRLLATELGWDAVDTDAVIEARLEMTVPEIFARRGEASFRQEERSILQAALQREKIVIATGGGAVAEDAIWGSDRLGAASVLTVALEAQPEMILSRLRDQMAADGESLARPLLTGADPLGRITGLKQTRQRFYDRASITLPVDNTAPGTTACEIAVLIRDAGDTIALDLPHAASRIVVKPGGFANVAGLMRDAYPGLRRTWVISDDRVAAFYLDPLASSLGDLGLEHRSLVVDHGEGSKSIAGAAGLYDALLTGGVERKDVLIALGGGVVGDLAGFVAATTLRGLGLVQVPTSLLAMVDSSVGGKTGINHQAGKNLIGAFYQPPLVVIDPKLLATLPPRELTSGWTEIIKHAVIQPSTPGGERSDLWGFLERNRDQLMQRYEPAVSYLIQRNVALKAKVVEADEREAGLRGYLNFGHTIGHAIEAAGYTLLHGEAVAVGMRAAMRLGERMNACSSQEVGRLDQLLDEFGLPATARADPARVLELLGSDKKKQRGKQRWVLPRAGGGVELRDDVPAEIVSDVLEAVLRPA